MSKLEKLYSIIENSRDVGVKLPKGVLQQVEELHMSRGQVPNMRSKKLQGSKSSKKR